MKKFKMSEEDAKKGLCWQYAIACMLGVSPKKVPDFVNGTPANYVERTREWLLENYGKSLVYIPVNQFMETGKFRYNPSNGPDGYSIMVILTEGDGPNHVTIAWNGGMYHDPTPLECTDFTGVLGYFVMYDL